MDTAKYKYRDDEYYKTKDFAIEDIEVPMLSVANWVCMRGLPLFHNACSLTVKLGRNSAPPQRKYNRLYASRIEVQIPTLYHWKA